MDRKKKFVSVLLQAKWIGIWFSLSAQQELTVSCVRSQSAIARTSLWMAGYGIWTGRWVMSAERIEIKQNINNLNLSSNECLFSRVSVIHLNNILLQSQPLSYTNVCLTNHQEPSAEPSGAEDSWGRHPAKRKWNNSTKRNNLLMDTFGKQ